MQYPDPFCCTRFHIQIPRLSLCGKDGKFQSKFWWVISRLSHTVDSILRSVDISYGDMRLSGFERFALLRVPCNEVSKSFLLIDHGSPRKAELKEMKSTTMTAGLIWPLNQLWASTGEHACFTVSEKYVMTWTVTVVILPDLATFRLSNISLKILSTPHHGSRQSTHQIHNWLHGYNRHEKLYKNHHSNPI